MTPERHQLLQRIFLEACARPPEARNAFLEQECGGDAELRGLLEDLLAHHSGAGTLAGGVRAPLGPGDAGQGGRLAPGDVLEGKYRIEALLGIGGMGEVYRATQLALDRTVALKVLLVGAGASARRRFRREALAVARLRHPNIVTVHDLGLKPGLGAYLVMEYVQGHSLRQELQQRGRLPAGEALAVMRQVCAGVQAAHDGGVVHRDLKPENILLGAEGAGAAKVADFGIAKLAEEVGAGESLTRTGAVLGTPTYMAPEQCRGEAVDGRADVYALGCVLYELLTGRPPFAAASGAALLLKHVAEAVPLGPLAAVAGDRLIGVVARALAKAPEARYQSPRELSDAASAAGAAVTAGGGPLESAAAWQVTGAAEPAATDPPVATPDTHVVPANNLPQAVTRFIGRASEIERVVRRLGEDRLVTLTGPGGIGKTRLALEVAREALEAFPGGVWLVDVTALADAALVPQAVAAALGVREEPGLTITQTLEAWLRERRALLVLDNCEHLVEACAALSGALLRACTALRVLATSRESLGVAGEAIWPVPPLSVPATDNTPGAHDASDADAVRLFADRAALGKPGFRLEGRTAPAVAALCRKLEGIPLAIELAAARVRVLSVEQIIERLDDRFRLLVGGGRTAPSRQQTLRATLDWSHDLLSEEERVLLRRLSVFAGGWTLEAAEAVCAGGGVEAEVVLELISGLANRSLVAAQSLGRAARYGMLETIREYARERLAGSPEAEELRRRHAEFFLAFAEAAEPELVGANASEWVDRLEVEHDNLRAALAWSLEHDPEVCLRLAVGIRLFWGVHGHMTEGRRWLSAVLKRSGDAPTPTRTKALRAAGHWALRQGEFEVARAYFEDALRIGREGGDTLLIAAASQGLGLVAMQQGDLRSARAYLQDGLARSREGNHDAGAAQALTALGEVARLEGDWAGARAFYEQALGLHKRAGFEHGVSVALGNLGSVFCEEGNLRDAGACYRQALAIVRKLGNKDGIANNLDGLAAVAARGGAWRRAARLAGAAEALYDAVGYVVDLTDRELRDRYLAEVRAGLGDGAYEEGLAEGRALTLEQALDLAVDDAGE